jgi:hypothetical protein
MINFTCNFPVDRVGSRIIVCPPHEPSCKNGRLIGGGLPGCGNFDINLHANAILGYYPFAFNCSIIHFQQYSSYQQLSAL